MPEVRVLRAGFSDMEFGLAFRPLCCFLTAVVRSHGLSVYMILTVAMVTALLPLASALDPCLKPEEVNENWRSTDEPPQDSNHRCDRGRFAPTKWYLFNIDGSNATIPTHCIKNKYCGTNIAMRIEMSGVPDEGQVVEAFLCGSYDVLGQYDCCVLRTPVRVSSCGGRLVYQFYQDFDRCDVAVCAQKEPVPPKVIAQMGEPYTDSLLTHNVTDGETTMPDPSSPLMSETATTDASHTTDQVKSEVMATSVSSTEVTGVTFSAELATETSAASTETSASTTETSASITETSAAITETSASSTETSASSTETSASTTETSVSITETSVSTPSTDKTDTAPTSQDVPPSQPTSESSSTSEEPSETATTVKKDTQCSDTSCQTGSIDTTTQEAKSDSAINQDAPLAMMSSTASSSTEEDGDSNSTLDFTSTLDSSTTATADTTTTLTVSTAATSDSSTEADDQNSTSSVPEYPPAAEPTKKDDIPEPPTDDVTTPVETTEESTTYHLSSPMTPSPHSDATTSDTPVMTSPVIRDTDISADTTSATASTTSSSTPTSVSSSSSPPSSSSSTTPTTTPSPRSTSSPPPITTSTEALTTQSTTTREPRDDVTITENMRLVFDGNYTNLLQAFSGHLVSYVYRILNNFLSRITYEAQPRWRFNISDAPLPSMGYHQDKTYVDVTITHNSGKFSGEIFVEHDLAKYFKDHTNLTLLTTCRTGQSCEMTSPVAQPTVFKKHAPVFIAVIILCSVCLLLIVIGLAWARFWRRGTYKAGGENVEQRVVAKDRPYYNATPSPFTDEQIMKDEVAEPSTKQPDTPMRDDEMNGNGDSTWVIPLDDAPVTYNMEDTKL